MAQRRTLRFRSHLLVDRSEPPPVRGGPRARTRAVARGVLGVLLALSVAGCWGWDPEPGVLILHNRSNEPVWVYIEGYGGNASLLEGPIRPGEEIFFFALPRGRKCPDASAFVLRDEERRELARRDNTVDPVCVDEPWVWTGE